MEIQYWYEAGICKSKNIKLSRYKDKNRTFLGHNVPHCLEKLTIKQYCYLIGNQQEITCGIE